MLCDDAEPPPPPILTNSSNASVDAWFNHTLAHIQQCQVEEGKQLDWLAQLQQLLKTQRCAIGALALLHSQYYKAMLQLL